MKNGTFLTLATGLLVLANLLHLSGCAGPYKDEKFRYSIAHTEYHPPARVVELVKQTVKALNLKEVLVKTTNIDGQFWVKSALGDEFKIIVQGVRTDKTLIEIYMASKKNSNQARLVLTEIRSRLARYIPPPAGAGKKRTK